MNYNFFRNNPNTFHALAFLMTALAMVLIGIIFLQVSSCRMADYMYTSGRLEGSGQTGFICKIF